MAPEDGTEKLEKAEETEEAFSELIRRWMADGDLADELRAKGDAGGPALEDAHLRPASWVHAPDSRRFQALLAGAVVASLVVIAVARSHSAPAPAAATVPAPAAAVASAPVPPPPAASAPTVTATVTVEAPRISVQAAAPIVSPHVAQKAAPRHEQRADSLGACRGAVGKGRPREALAACRVAVDAAPRSDAAVLLLAQAHFLAGQEHATLELARRVVAMNPRTPDAYLLIGSVEQTSGHKRDARSAYEAYLRLAPRGRHAAEVRTVLRTL
jgi:hypothetical protein